MFCLLLHLLEIPTLYKETRILSDNIHDTLYTNQRAVYKLFGINLDVQNKIAAVHRVLIRSSKQMSAMQHVHEHLLRRALQHINIGLNLAYSSSPRTEIIEEKRCITLWY
jgi:hypothetical protein